MSRVQRADNVGMPLIRGGHQRPYGNCPRCQQLKPIYWTSRVDFLCYTCLKKSSLHQFIPPVGARNQDLLDRTPHTKRLLRARPLRQQPSRSMKPIAPQQQKKRQPPQQSPVNAKTIENERSIPPPSRRPGSVGPAKSSRGTSCRAVATGTRAQGIGATTCSRSSPFFGTAR